MSTHHPLDENQATSAVKAAFDAVKADDVRVTLTASDTGFTRWAANEVTTSGVVEDVHASITCAVGARHATVDLHGLDPARIADAARRALALAELAPEDPEWVPDVGTARVTPVPAAWAESTAKATPETRAQLVADSLKVAKAHKLVGAGFVQHQRSSFVVATRRGFFGMHHATEGSLSTTARTPDGAGSGWASSAGVKAEDVEARHTTELACDKAAKSHKPEPLPPGEYPVVLEPAAVAGLLGSLHWQLDARAADEGRSCFAKAGGTRVGEKIFGALQLVSDPAFPLLPSAPFDGEGLPRRAFTWVKDGVLERLRYSRYWAKKTGQTPDARVGVMIPRGPKASSLEELIAGLDRGLVVTRFWYIRMLEPQTLRVTGLTRDGVLYVEKGKVVRPVNNFRFNQSVLEMFANADAYGPPVPVVDEDGSISVAPAVRCTRFHMASRSDAV
jgi:predicted Zn-dependent protease